MTFKKDYASKLTRLIIRFIYGKERSDEVYGDLEELYQQRSLSKGKWLASLHYVKDVLLSFRNIGLSDHPPVDFLGMTSNYVKVTFRTLGRHRTYSVLNILGLALGTAAFIFIHQYVVFERSYDRSYKNHEDLYRVTYKVYNQDELLYHSAAIPPTVAPFMQDKLPGVTTFTRAYLWDGYLVISYKDKKYREERVFMVDPGFLDVFDLSLVEGNPTTALSTYGAVVLSESAKRKYFGNEDAVGKTLSVDGLKDYKVTGVFKKMPANSHLQFDLLFSYETIKLWSEGETETDWYSDEFYSYIVLHDQVDPEAFLQDFNRFYDLEWGDKNSKDGVWKEYFLQPVVDIHLHSKLDREIDPAGQGDALSVLFLSIIGYALLFMAWMNYINLATARAIERAKEVGVRKIAGAHKRQLVFQFMVESSIINLLAIMLALGIVLGTFQYFKRIDMEGWDIAFLKTGIPWPELIAAYLFGSLLAGFYPALVLSSFKPIAVLKGKWSSSTSGNRLRKILVVFQFTVSVSMIAATIIIFLQLHHMKTQPLGFDNTQVLVVRGPGVTDTDVTENAFFQRHTQYMHRLQSTAGIISVTSGTNVPGEDILEQAYLKKQGEPGSELRSMPLLYIGFDYFSTLGVRFRAGRSFSKAVVTDTLAVVLNRSAIQKLGFDSAQDAVGQYIVFSSGLEAQVIGVVSDYQQQSVKTATEPLVFYPYPEEHYYYMIKLPGGNIPLLLQKVQEHYKVAYPNDPFDYFFLDEYYNRQYSSDHEFNNIFMVFAIFTIWIACLGLYGLSSFSATKRSREIGIRKILGANVPNIVRLISTEFLVLAACAYIIALPVIYFSMTEWLSTYATRIVIGPKVFILTGLILALTILLTVGHKTLAAARSNPVDALRSH